MILVVRNARVTYLELVDQYCNTIFLLQETPDRFEATAQWYMVTNLSVLEVVAKILAL